MSLPLSSSFSFDRDAAEKLKSLALSSGTTAENVIRRALALYEITLELKPGETVAIEKPGGDQIVLVASNEK